MGKLDIDIWFEKRWYGDNNLFDGEGKIFVYVYFLWYGGDVYFDDDEKWIINIVKGKVLVI